MLAQAVALQPAIILLDSAWQHADYTLEAQDIAPLIVQTVARIRERLPHTRIVVVGPVPHWTTTLPGIYRRALVLHKPMPAMSSAEFLDQPLFALDRELDRELRAAGLRYISVVGALCTQGTGGMACLSRLGDAEGDIAYVDEEHLSQRAAAFLVKKIENQIFGDAGSDISQRSSPAITP